MEDHVRTSIRDYVSAKVIEPGDPAYDKARALYNAMIDKRPRWIVQCRTAEDVADAIRFAREQDVPLAVASGRHNGAGLSSVDDGLVIDLSQMKRISVDAERRTVRAEPGLSQGEIDRYTHEVGLAVPAGIVSTTGIAGLTLGGGHGYLSRKHGLTIDNLIEAEVVLADGRRVTASADENSDLLWALKGGGGNFGVVVSFLFQAHPVKDVYGGPIFYDIEHAAMIMNWYRDFLPGAPRELMTFLGLKTVPSHVAFPEELWGRRIVALISCYNGTREDGEAAMSVVREALPKPLLDGMDQMPFPDLQALFDALIPPGLQWYWKGEFIDELSDEAIAAHVKHGSNTPTELSLMHLYPIDGAVHDVGPGETAWGARRAQWSMVIAGIDPDPAAAPALKQWATDYWRAIHGLSGHGGAYVNFMNVDEGEGRVQAAYGENFERLVAVKRRYDPGNLFRINHNISPLGRAA